MNHLTSVSRPCRCIASCLLPLQEVEQVRLFLNSCSLVNPDLVSLEPGPVEPAKTLTLPLRSKQLIGEHVKE